ncbi:MAG: (5-formylfuran-3-yl)methyl phosphate synthase [Planctomycetota bacterium]
MNGGVLVSVRDSEEARAALAGGAAVIDVKEPRHGPLGCAAPETVAAVGRAVAGAVPWTVALGELADGPAALARRFDDVVTALAGAMPPAAVKVGLAGMDRQAWERDLATVFARLGTATAPVAVAYADHEVAVAPDPRAVVAAAARLGCRWLLIDTADKSRGSMMAGAAAASLAGWIAAAHGARLSVVLAGSLTLDDLPAAVAIGAALVGLRTAVCCGGRLGVVDEGLVRAAVTAAARARRCSAVTAGADPRPR